MNIEFILISISYLCPVSSRGSKSELQASLYQLSFLFPLLAVFNEEFSLITTIGHSYHQTMEYFHHLFLNTLYFL